MTTVSTQSDTGTSLGTIEATFRARRAVGRKLLVPYLTGGLGPRWVEALQAVAASGADAIEVGLPFSDPVMDGPTIQAASVQALSQGATPAGIVATLGEVAGDIDVPLAVMTYYNPVLQAGLDRFAHSLADSAIAGAIVPDLPLEESNDWEAEAARAGVETILLAAPTTPDDRLALICRRSRGWIYGVGLMGVTGERTSLCKSVAVIAKRLKAVTDKPVLIGIGISNADQAAEACVEADGVVVGSALVRRLLDGGGPDEAAAFVAELRAGLDRVT